MGIICNAKKSKLFVSEQGKLRMITCTFNVCRCNIILPVNKKDLIIEEGDGEEEIAAKQEDKSEAEQSDEKELEYNA